MLTVDVWFLSHLLRVTFTSPSASSQDELLLPPDEPAAARFWLSRVWFSHISAPAFLLTSKMRWSAVSS